MMIETRIKELRDALALSMPEFGRRLGCSRDVIANIEYGRVEPKDVFLNHLCDVFGVSPQWLYFGEEPMFTPGRHDEKVREATAIFRALSPDLRELALSQLKSLQKLMAKKAAAEAREAKDNVDTIRLMAAMMDAPKFGALKGKTGKQVRIGERIREIMEDKQVSRAQLAAASTLTEAELDNILGSEDDPEGNTAAASRESLIAISLALTLDIEETQRLLTAAGHPALYAKNRRDAACIFALMKQITIAELNELLIDLEEPAL
jgi:transcriptional regulator with XRE-family HTH domain